MAPKKPSKSTQMRAVRFITSDATMSEATQGCKARIRRRCFVHVSLASFGYILTLPPFNCCARVHPSGHWHALLPTHTSAAARAPSRIVPTVCTDIAVADTPIPLPRCQSATPAPPLVRSASSPPARQSNSGRIALPYPVRRAAVAVPRPPSTPLALSHAAANAAVAPPTPPPPPPAPNRSATLPSANVAPTPAARPAS